MKQTNSKGTRQLSYKLWANTAKTFPTLLAIWNFTFIITIYIYIYTTFVSMSDPSRTFVHIYMQTQYTKHKGSINMYCHCHRTQSEQSMHLMFFFVSCQYRSLSVACSSKHTYISRKKGGGNKYKLHTIFMRNSAQTTRLNSLSVWYTYTNFCPAILQKYNTYLTSHPVLSYITFL
jgi:hypothetical protein